MISNLFSIFDPTTEINNLSLNWTRTAIGLLLIPSRIWLIPSRNRIIVRLLINKLHQEIKTILRKGNENKGNSFILTSLFLIILINNFLGLFPYIFTRTRHLTLTLTLALPLWMRFILFGWIKNTNHIFEYLVPQGTPSILIWAVQPVQSHITCSRVHFTFTLFQFKLLSICKPQYLLVILYCFIATTCIAINTCLFVLKHFWAVMHNDIWMISR